MSSSLAEMWTGCRPCGSCRKPRCASLSSVPCGPAPSPLAARPPGVGDVGGSAGVAALCPATPRARTGQGRGAAPSRLFEAALGRAPWSRSGPVTRVSAWGPGTAHPGEASLYGGSGSRPGGWRGGPPAREGLTHRRAPCRPRPVPPSPVGRSLPPLSPQVPRASVALAVGSLSGRGPRCPLPTWLQALGPGSVPGALGIHAWASYWWLYFYLKYG